MANVIDGEKKKALKDIWGKYDGQKRLTDRFVQELAYFFDNCPELITGSNKKIETQHSRDYSDVAKHCGKLLKTLEKIPDLDRINLLSIYENSPEFSDPLDHVKGIQKRAEFQSDQLKKCNKYERQLDGLRDFLSCFPPLRNINHFDLLELAGILWDGIKDDSVAKTYQHEEKVRQK